jgi:pimeloyl-ACP methyl ester carboxylesterase
MLLDDPTFTRSSFTTIDGVTLTYFDTGGQGEPVVVLHGLAGSALEFVDTATALPEFRVILLDLRGHGRSTRIPADVTREAFVADVVQLLEHARTGPATLIGQSMGAHTAMLVAAHHPDRVSRLVLLETTEGSGDVADTSALSTYFDSWPVPFASREAAADFLGNGPLQQAWVADLERTNDGFIPRFDPTTMGKIMETLVVPRWAEWTNLSCPTLAVFADHGMFSNEDKNVFVARGQNVTRVDLPNASHDAHLDAAAQWISTLRGFLLNL